MKKKIAGLLIAGVALIAGMAATSPGERYFEIAKNLDIFASMFKEVNAFYVDEVNPNTLMRTGIDAMLESLDPYTNYIPEDEVENFRTANTGQYGGIGAATRTYENRTIVTMVFEGYGAQKGGLKIGDEIVGIGGKELSKLSAEETGQLMKGQIGSIISLTIKRAGTDSPINLSFKREKIKISNVPYTGMITPDIGYVKLSDFMEDAGREVRNAVEVLKGKGAKSIVLDLRGNPGGLLTEAVNVCNVFLPKGKLVVSTKGKIKEQNLNYETLNPPLDAEMPVVVLINRSSASASEIVAGTLQDYDRALILGERSFGKGLVQVPRPLSYNSQLKVTTAKYYTPTGRCIQALDYSHRRDDGSVGSIADSLKRPFKTSKNRIVYDGGGIEPDVTVALSDPSPLAQALVDQGILTDFVSHYLVSHSDIQSIDYTLSDQGYADFVSWMKTKQYSFVSALEEAVINLEAEAKKDNSVALESIKNLRNTIRESRKNELITHKNEIQNLIEQDILSRFYLERGLVHASFRNDKALEGAKKILTEQVEYQKILRIP